MRSFCIQEPGQGTHAERITEFLPFLDAFSVGSAVKHVSGSVVHESAFCVEQTVGRFQIVEDLPVGLFLPVEPGSKNTLVGRTGFRHGNVTESIGQYAVHPALQGEGYSLVVRFWGSQLGIEPLDFFGIVDPFVVGVPCSVAPGVCHVPPSDPACAVIAYETLHQRKCVVVIAVPVISAHVVKNRVEQSAGIHLFHTCGVCIQFIEVGT